jgi:hypothetical protein
MYLWSTPIVPLAVVTVVAAATVAVVTIAL